MGDSRQTAQRDQRASYGKRGHASAAPVAAAIGERQEARSASGATGTKRLTGPRADTCVVCGGRAPWGLFGRSYCRDHLPDEFWDVKRKAEEAHRSARGAARGQAQSGATGTSSPARGEAVPPARVREHRPTRGSPPPSGKQGKPGQGSLF